MSTSPSEEEMLMYLPYEKWKASAESILTQKIVQLTKSESLFKFSQYNPNLTFSQLELREIYLKNFSEKAEKWEMVREKCRFPRVIRTRSLLRDELEMLKINLSMHDKRFSSRESHILEERNREGRRRKARKLMKTLAFEHSLASSKVRDLLYEIDGSETAKTDKVTWKFLKRGHSIRKEAVKAKKFVLEVQTLYLPVLELLSNSHLQNVRPIKITCPNCGFFIVTQVKKISTLKTKLTSLILAFIGKMVSASSTSAKNLFVESKLRLSDRVQVNVNNIAAIARQIQRGSKANENLITAAKNFALQEAAIENSETNLKKLKLLTTHLNNQLDSLHNSSSKIEVVLEQVCSMQR